CGTRASVSMGYTHFLPNSQPLRIKLSKSPLGIVDSVIQLLRLPNLFCLP
ncbi:unnamed protein product, partial [Cuscuta campestris]